MLNIINSYYCIESTLRYKGGPQKTVNLQTKASAILELTLILKGGENLAMITLNLLGESYHSVDHGGDFVHCGEHLIQLSLLFHQMSTRPRLL